MGNKLKLTTDRRLLLSLHTSLDQVPASSQGVIEVQMTERQTSNHCNVIQFEAIPSENRKYEQDVQNLDGDRKFTDYYNSVAASARNLKLLKIFCKFCSGI